MKTDELMSLMHVPLIFSGLFFRRRSFSDEQDFIDTAWKKRFLSPTRHYSGRW